MKQVLLIFMFSISFSLSVCEEWRVWESKVRLLYNNTVFSNNVLIAIFN